MFCGSDGPFCFVTVSKSGEGVGKITGELGFCDAALAQKHGGEGHAASDENRCKMMIFDKHLFR